MGNKKKLPDSKKADVKPGTRRVEPLTEDSFAQELERDSDSDEPTSPVNAATSSTEETKTDTATKLPSSADPVFDTNDEVPLTDAEKELLKEELRKTEDEILTLRQVLLARQKHAAELKRKLGLTPLSELTSDINKSLKTMTDSEAFHRTQEVAAATADTVKEKWTGMRNSSLFKSFETKIGTAYQSARVVASTSIDQLSGAARGTTPAATPSEESKPLPK